MKFWYSYHLGTFLLLPLAWLFGIVSHFRRKFYQWNWLKSYHPSIPVVVVGNLSVGGNGKTPVVIWLAEQLQMQGLAVGIISRGYGGKNTQFPCLVTENSDALQMGDEPVLMAKRLAIPVAISPNRREAIELLLQQYSLDLIISDDGLQHYALQRDVEIVVIDGERRFGNGLLLPAGPLRESVHRLKTVDLVICNGVSPKRKKEEKEMQLQAQYAINLVNGTKKALSDFEQVNAIAGIGYPQRFFNMLQRDFALILHHQQAFSDHYSYNINDFSSFSSDYPLLMTEKDAVKCCSFAKEEWWYVPVNAVFSEQDATTILHKVRNYDRY